MRSSMTASSRSISSRSSAHGGATGLAVVTATIVPATELSDFPPGVMVILGFGVLTLLAQLIRRRA